MEPVSSGGGEALSGWRCGETVRTRGGDVTSGCCLAAGGVPPGAGEGPAGIGGAPDKGPWLAMWRRCCILRHRLGIRRCLDGLPVRCGADPAVSANTIL